jgi:endonuclease/exonuclease/phosphatase family metal-dependent hydrolase
MLSLALTLLLLPSAVLAGGDRDDRGHRDDRTLTVMTRNVYVGFDFAPIFQALASGNPTAVVFATKTAFDALKAADFNARANAIADEIERTRPDVVGLQEVFVLRSQDPPDGSPTPNASTIEFDYLAILQTALEARRLDYELVAVVPGTDAELPALRDDFTCCRQLRATDRDVLLVRRGIRVLGVHAGNFRTQHADPCGLCPGGTFRFHRGWVAIDALVDGHTVRIVSTHLEPESDPTVQLMQARELLAGPADTALPLILLGDFNSRADGTGTATYPHLVGTGLADTWLDAHPSRPGFTCCHAADLRNPTPTLDMRIDLILTRGPFDVRHARVVGDELRDRTRSGLWPSDHAGVVAELNLRAR